MIEKILLGCIATIGITMTVTFIYITIKLLGGGKW